jgi:hypothetical protein
VARSSHYSNLPPYPQNTLPPPVRTSATVTHVRPTPALLPRSSLPEGRRSNSCRSSSRSSSGRRSAPAVAVSVSHGEAPAEEMFNSPFALSSLDHGQSVHGGYGWVMYYGYPGVNGGSVDSGYYNHFMAPSYSLPYPTLIDPHQSSFMPSTNHNSMASINQTGSRQTGAARAIQPSMNDKSV